MLGGIIGDLAGTKYEYQEFLDSRKGIINVERRRKILNSDIELLTNNSFISDDSLLTIAIAEAIIYNRDYKEALKKYGQKYGNTPVVRDGFFKNAFSPSFIKWANSECDLNGNSEGNGAAMRVSPIAFLFNDLKIVEEEARKATIPSHNSYQAIRGAQCLAGTIFLARKKENKAQIAEYVTKKYGYDLDYNLEELQEKNTFNGTCEVTVPQAIFLFLQSNNFEDSIRKAISIGGDTDTIACMVGGISEAYYGIPRKLRNRALELLPEDLRNIVINIYEKKKVMTLKKNQQDLCI